jgi:hypothetical protein
VQPADQNRFIDCPVRFQSNRLKNFFTSEWHRQHQIVSVKADLLKATWRLIASRCWPTAVAACVTEKVNSAQSLPPRQIG